VETGLDFYTRIWHPVALVVSDIERNGICFNKAAAGPLLEKTTQEREELRQQLDTVFGVSNFNWGSWQQLGVLLHDELRLPVSPIEGTGKAPKKAKPGSRPTGEAALQWIRANARDEAIKGGLTTLLRWKKVKKQAEFWELLPRFVGHDARIHCQLSISGDGESGGTETGRLTSRNPNLQQIPKDKTFRDAFGAAPGYRLVVLDYKGLEWRVMAHILAHKYADWSLVEEIKAGIDPHAATAEKMGVGDREVGKILNYSINYGKSATGLSLQLAITQKQAQGYLDAFFRARPGIRRFHRDIVGYARESGFIRSLLGRHRYLDFEANPRRAERQALNVIQPAATDVMVMAMLRAHRSPELTALGAKLVLQVHDELVIEAPAANAQKVFEVAKHEMETALAGVRDDFKCPLEVEGGTGETWGSAK
jgi:DNA polymerase-1